MKRKLIAIGDLHGDVHRLIRILAEEKVLDPVSLQWTEAFNFTDVVLLGDYVDWRNEKLEGPREEWPLGPRKVLELIYQLSQQQKQLMADKKTQGRFYPVCGNHDVMMVQSHAILEKFCKKEVGVLERFTDIEALIRALPDFQLDFDEQNEFLEFLNWYQQGGKQTIESFGGLRGWLAAIGGELGEFVRRLPFAVVVNKKLFSHSIPDSKEHWVPIHDSKMKDPQHQDYGKIREQYIWGRKLWGYDAFAGGKTTALSEEDIDEMLSKLEVTAAVVGHTALHRKEPYYHFGGKIINLDTHGIPGSQAFVEEYEAVVEPPTVKKKRGKRKRRR